MHYANVTEAIRASSLKGDTHPTLECEFEEELSHLCDGHGATGAGIVYYGTTAEGRWYVTIVPGEEE